MLLEPLGHNVQIARNGHQAIDVARALRPDYVLLDIGLPGLNGYEVAAALRQEMPGMLVILAASGYADEEYREKGLAAGCNHYFAKPVD
jgi:CheY-like chemotaxis protein